MARASVAMLAPPPAVAWAGFDPGSNRAATGVTVYGEANAVLPPRRSWLPKFNVDLFFNAAARIRPV